MGALLAAGRGPRIEGVRSRRVPGLGARVLVLGSALTALACSGGDDRVPVFPVEGKLLFKGKPAPGAFVVFHPADRDPKVAAVRPSAQVSPDGSFRLTTYEAQDGAPASDYVVTVEWRKLVGKGNDVIAGPNVIPSKYGRPETSDLKFKVARGPNVLPPLEIATASRRDRR